MSGFFDRFLPDDVKERGCQFQCNEPRGSIAAGLVVMAAGFIIVPAFVRIASGSIPFTPDAFLQALFFEVSNALNYHVSSPIMTYVIYFIFSLVAGMLSIKTARSALLAPIFIGILFIVFFFLAYFILGIVVNIDEFMAGLGAGLLLFLATMLLPSLLGSVVMNVLFSLKKCYVMGSGTITKK
jgi:hypothetical protein